MAEKIVTLIFYESTEKQFNETMTQSSFLMTIFSKTTGHKVVNVFPPKNKVLMQKEIK